MPPRRPIPPALAAALIIGLAIVFSGCATHQHYTYFAPQGPGRVLTFSNHPPEDTLELIVLPSGFARLHVTGRMLGDQGHIRLTLIFHHDGTVRFSSKTARLLQGTKDWIIAPDWEVTGEPKPGSTRLPFDAPLVQTPYYGSYGALLALPAGLDPTQPFQLVLPATDVWPGATIAFTSKVADFWRHPEA